MFRLHTSREVDIGPLWSKNRLFGLERHDYVFCIHIYTIYILYIYIYIYRIYIYIYNIYITFVISHDVASDR